MLTSLSLKAKGVFAVFIVGILLSGSGIVAENQKLIDLGYLGMGLGVFFFIVLADYQLLPIKIILNNYY